MCNKIISMSSIKRTLKRLFMLIVLKYKHPWEKKLHAQQTISMNNIKRTPKQLFMHANQNNYLIMFE